MVYLYYSIQKGWFLHEMKTFKRISAIVALIFMLIFTVGWIAILAVPSIRSAPLITLVIFCGIFGVIMYFAIKLYKTPEDIKEEEERKQAIMEKMAKENEEKEREEENKGESKK